MELYYFTATWCPGCRAVSPIVKSIEADYQSKIKFHIIDVDASPEVAQKYDVSALPTIIISKSGEVTDRIKGPQTKSMLVKRIEQQMN
jgi:thioredoxin 1